MSTAKRRKKKKNNNKIALFAVEIIVLVALLVGMYLYFKVDKVDSTGEIDEGEVNIELDSETKEVLEGYTNIAIFGLDNRDTGNYNGGNSDSIMIVSINNDTKEVKLVSVYRDSYLNVYDNKYFRINSAYAHGGPKAAIAALNKNLNLDITDYVAVDFKAMVDAVDLLDGIEIDVSDKIATNMNQNYIDEINEVTNHSSSKLSGGGLQTLDGVQTLAYCRVRKVDSDFNRTERQRMVLSKMIDKAKGSSISTIASLIDSMFGEISTSFTSKELVALASSVMDYELVGNIGWPFELCTGKVGGADVVIPTDLKANVEDLHMYLFNEHNTVSNTVSGINDRILNDTGCSREAATRIVNPVTGEDSTGSANLPPASTTTGSAEKTTGDAETGTVTQ